MLLLVWRSSVESWVRRLEPGPAGRPAQARGRLAAVETSHHDVAQGREIHDFTLPNGLAFSPNESLLYIDDSAQKHIRAFTVRNDGSLHEGRVLLDMASDDSGVPDGLKVDEGGNVFCTGPGGVWVCRADGTLLGRIVLPELPANLAWGEDGSVLFVTARTSVYRLQTKTRGALLA